MIALTRFGAQVVSLCMLGAVAAGCTMGVNPASPGYQALTSHNFAAARADFAEAYTKNPHDPFVELDLAAAYQNLGRMDLAEPFYRGVIADGKGIMPETTMLASDSGLTLDQIACKNLRMGLGANARC